MTIGGDTESLVYSRPVVEFATVAKEFCAYIESTNRLTRQQFVQAASKLLGLLYYKASLLPRVEPIYGEGIQRHVAEEDYQRVHSSLRSLMGPHDDFAEVFDPRVSEVDEPFSATISEYLADVYQDLKNFTGNYQAGHTGEMNDALWECKLNFEEYWGIRLANTIRAIHLLAYGSADLSEPNESESQDIPHGLGRDTSK